MASERQVYFVGAELYESLLRNNSQNAAAVDRRGKLLVRARLSLSGAHHTDLIDAIDKELNGTSTLRSH